MTAAAASLRPSEARLAAWLLGAVILLAPGGASGSNHYCVMTQSIQGVNADAIFGGTSPPPGSTCSSGGFNTFCSVDPTAIPGQPTATFDAGSGTYTVRVENPVTLPGNEANFNAGIPYSARIVWFAQAEPPPTNCFPGGFPGNGCQPMAFCGLEMGGGPRLNFDFGTTYIQISGLTCGNFEGHPAVRKYSFSAYVCHSPFTDPPCIRRDDATVDLSEPVIRALLECPIDEPPSSCQDEEGAAAGTCCIGPGGSAPGVGPPGPSMLQGEDSLSGTAPRPSIGASVSPAQAAPPGMPLVYFAGGAGFAGLPENLAWGDHLGAGWSHPFSQRIVEAPDETNVWLITPAGTFRHFTGLNGSNVYDTVAPSDEYRTLEWLNPGWLLHGLDGTDVHFRGDGLWEKTVDRTGHEAVGSYDGTPRLTGVNFPDGRSLVLGYDAAGTLDTVTEVGVDPATTRSWSYDWSGDLLDRIDRPDGTAWVFSYATGATTRMTHMRLEPVGGGTARVVAAWQYDTEDKLLCAWRNAETCLDPGALERWQWNYVSETETQVTDPYGNVITYTFDRELASGKPRVLSMDSDCPVCGGGSPTTVTEYDDPLDPSHPLLPWRVTDAAGHVTEFAYDAFGQVVLRTDALGSPEQRSTTWVYDADFPAFPTTIARPSAVPTCTDPRSTSMVYDPANGNLSSGTVSGCEQPGDTAATAYTTVYDYTGTTAGQPTAIDPPGHGTTNVTTFVYDPARGDQVALSRSDPDPLLPGGAAATSFHYDDYNRRIGVTDPNGVTAEVQYDDLDRVRFVIQRSGTLGVDYQLGDPPDPADLATEHRYDAFGDLALSILPEGNAIEYGYDSAGRLVTIDRRADEFTPATERTEFTLDAFGRRILEDLQAFEGAAWVSKSKTESVYATRCHLDKVIHNPDAAPPDQEVTEYGYDCDGNLARVWDAEHPNPDLSAAEYGYDALHRLTQVAQRWGGPSAADACPDAQGSCALTDYGYDVQDHLTSVTDAEANTTTYVYNDRDLLVREVSPVSGTTGHTYDPHGELATTTDARGVVVTRTVDAADRVTHVDYGADDALDVDYGYGTQAAQFEIGRLTGITRRGETLAYEYDEFGRTLRDGELTLTHDENGNVESVTYPGGVVATYGYDLADRPESLAVDAGSGPVSVADNATYLPSGPLTGLELGNGLTESRGATERYFPAAIAVTSATGPPPLFAWDYTVDAMGNVTGIDAQLCPDELILANETVSTPRTVEACQALKAGPDLHIAASGDLTLRAGTSVVLRNGFSVGSGGLLTAGTDPVLTGGVGESRSYEYQDYQYFLAGADGPWGTLDWTYDTVGDRLAETRDGATPDIYVYPSNGTGNQPQLSQIQLGMGGTRDYGYGTAGHVELVQSGANPIDFGIDDEGRLAALDRFGQTDVVALTYDGRSFLCRAEQTTGALARTEPVYDSQGRVMTLRRFASGTAVEEPVHYFYFAGRPVAQLAIDSGGLETWTYLTTDHLGTPVLATDSAGGLVWQGGFEPFGRDWRGGSGDGASENGLFLRLPGQWDDGSWEDAASAAGLFYNVHRWYENGTGRYTRPDPWGIDGGGPNVYLYGGANPLTNSDPDGRFIPRPCKMDDRQWCQQQCDRLKRRLVNCSCFGVPFCFGLFDYAVAQCDDWQKGCPPCPPPPPPVVDDDHGHGNCKPGQGHWHYFEYHQGPPPQCICRKVRRFGGCL